MAAHWRRSLPHLQLWLFLPLCLFLLLASACSPAPDEEAWAMAEALDAAENFRSSGDVGAEPLCPDCRIILEPVAEMHLAGNVEGTPRFGHVAVDSARVWISLPGLEAPLLVYGHDGARLGAVHEADGRRLRAPLLVVLDGADSAHAFQEDPPRYLVLGGEPSVARSYPLAAAPRYATAYSRDRIVVSLPMTTPQDIRRLQYLNRHGELFTAFDGVPAEEGTALWQIPARLQGRRGSLFALADSGFDVSRFAGNGRRAAFTAERPWGLPPDGPSAAHPVGLTLMPVESRTQYRLVIVAWTGDGEALQTRIDALHPTSVQVLARTVLPGAVIPVPDGWAYRLSGHVQGGTRFELFRLRLEGDPTR